MPRAAPGVLGTVASGKNVWFKIAQRQFQRYSVVLVAKKRKSPPPPLSETDRKAVGIKNVFIIIIIHFRVRKH